MKIEDLSTLIQSRRAIFPPVFTAEPVPISLIQQILENANWAPTHRRTEPWRFQVFRGPAKERLAEAMVEAFIQQQEGTEIAVARLDKIRNNVHRSDTVIVIVLQRDLQERIPEWEEIAALGAAVQNLWLTVSAAGLGGYWSTPAFYTQMDTFLELEDGQRCMGFFYVGHYEMPELPGSRGLLEAKVRWHTS